MASGTDPESMSGEEIIASTQEPAEELVVRRDVRCGTQRSFLAGLVLAIVTLGLYPIWWHWTVHKELSAQVGRAPSGRRVWTVACVLYVAATAAGLMDVIPGRAHEETESPTPTVVTTVVEGSAGENRSKFFEVPGWSLLRGVLQIAAFFPYASFVHDQYRLLDRTKTALRIPYLGWPGSFALVAGGFVLTGLLPTTAPLVLVLGIGLTVGLALVNSNLQGEYNSVWRHLADTRTELPPPAPAPRGDPLVP